MIRVGIHEPDAHVRLLLEAQVRALGHEPLLDAAEEEAPRSDVDLVLVETATPRGLAFARRLRRERPDIALAVVSVSDPTDATRALAAEAHLVKPFRLAELDRVLRDVVVSRS